MFPFTSLSTAVYSSCALALASLVRLLFSTVFLSLLVSSLWMVSAEIHSLCWVFLPRTSSRVSCQSFLQCSQCVSMSVSLSSISSCSGWNLLERLIWKAACVSLSLSSPTLYFVRVLLAVVNLLERSLTVVIRRWWSDDTSAPLVTRTSCHDLLNLRLMHMWSIWFSVTWFGDIHVALWMRLLWEDAASYHQLVQGAQVCKALTIFIHLSQSMCPHDVLVARVVHSNLGVEISHQYGYVLCSSSV